MDKRAYVWLFNNLARYRFDSPEAVALRDTISRMLITETSIESEEISQGMENCYSSFLRMFYNNVYGYQNGLVNKPISSHDLDCYFIETSEGILPIGYYKTIRPAEAVLTVQKYLEDCTENITTEKNRIVIDWQRRTNAIAGKFETVKNSGTPSMVKAVLGIVSSVLLLFISIISLIRMNLLGVILNMGNPQMLKNIISGIPFNKSGDMGVWIAYLIFVFVCILIVLIGVICTVMEFRLLNEKKKTEELLNNILGYTNNLDGGVNFALSNGNEMIKNAIRRGDNMIITPNNNSMLISTVSKQLQSAEDFTSKTAFQRSGIWYAIIAVIFVLFVLLTLSQFSAVTDVVESAFSSSDTAGDINSSDGSDTADTADTADTPDTPAVPDKPKVSRYITRKEDVTWTQAQSNAQYEGGNIISINTYEEFEKACAMAEQAGLRVCWVGSRINRGELWDNAKSLDGKELYVARWFSRNGVTEPTYVDDLGNEELYLMMFKINGEWYYNDAANDAIAASKNQYKGKIGYIIEIEE